jgi:hypothetical protein
MISVDDTVEEETLSSVDISSIVSSIDVLVTSLGEGSLNSMSSRLFPRLKLLLLLLHLVVER